MTDLSSPIKTMKLYTHVERVERELAAQGLNQGPLATEDLVAMDQLHYGGVAVVDEAIEQLGLQSGDHVLDVGAGLGGPARHIAKKVGCAITAVELQSDLNTLAQQLTERCQLGDQITHQCGDILDTPLPSQSFDALVSWLTVLHIPDRDALFSRCHEAIKTGGQIYIEDFCAQQVLSREVKDQLAEDVFCHYLPTSAQYEQDLLDAGFVSIEMENMSPDWTKFVSMRLAKFQAGADEFVARHGEPTYRALHHFYRSIVRLFDSGAIGGLRIQAVAAR